STRMVGAVVMAHGDDSGLQLPPRIAPVQVIVVPIFRSDVERAQIASALTGILDALDDIRVKVDWRDERPGFKFNEWELKGVPVRIESGPRDLASGQVTVVRRLGRQKKPVPLAELQTTIPAMLEHIKEGLFKRAREFREAHTVRPDSLAAMGPSFGECIGHVITPWRGRAADEQAVQQATTATTRVIDRELPPGHQPCAVCGRPAN